MNLGYLPDESPNSLDLGTVSGAVTLAVRTIRSFTMVLGGAATLYVIEPAASNPAQSLTLSITSAGFPVTWPSNVRWITGVAPTLTSGGTDIVDLTTFDRGIHWAASVRAAGGAGGGGIAEAPTDGKAYLRGSSGWTAGAPVALSGKYVDLTGAPNLKAVATSGSYADLANKPLSKAGAYPGDQIVASGGWYTGQNDSGIAGNKINYTKKLVFPNGGSDIRLLFSNCNGQGESQLYSFAFSGSIQRNSDAPIQLTWSGSTQLVFTNTSKQFAWNDVLRGYSFAPGDSVTLHGFVDAGAGTYPQGMNLDMTAGDKYSFSATDVDQTMNPGYAYPNPGANYIFTYGPQAIIGKTGVKNASIVIYGDSIIAGYGDLLNYGWGQRALGGVAPFTALGSPGEDTSVYASYDGFSMRREAGFAAAKAIFEISINSFSHNISLSDTQNQCIDAWVRSFFLGQQVWQTTATPFTDVGNTTPQKDATRQPFNAWLRAGAPITFIGGVYTAVTAGTSGAILSGSANHPLYKVLDVAAVVEQGGASAPTGLWQSAYVSADGVHPPTNGHAAIAASINATAIPDLFSPVYTLADFNSTSGPSQILNKPKTMVGSGNSHAGGLVPDPGTVAGTGRYLNETGQWIYPNSTYPSVTPTLRNIATRCRHDYQLYTGANLIGCYGRTGHINMGDTVNSIQVVVGNWYANNVNEYAGNSAVTEYIAIEYPSGVYTLATWNTAAGQTAQRQEYFSNPAGNDAVCDPIVVTIPRGATFWVRRLSRWTDGVARQFSVSASAVAAPMDSLFFGFSAESTVNDVRGYLTSSLTPTGPATMAQVRFPLAILGMSTVPSAMIIGDSRASGRSDANQATIANNPSPATNFAGASDFAGWGMGEIARSIGHGRPYVNLGCETDAARTFNTVAHTYRARQQAYHTDVISEYGINDVNLGNRTAAATQIDLLAIYGLFPTKRVWQSTISPVSTSTDSWATVANQTTATINPQRTALNDWIRANTAGIFGYFEVADVMETARNSGIWNVQPNLGAPTGDGLHETPSYYKYIDTMKAIDPARLVPV